MGFAYLQGCPEYDFYATVNIGASQVPLLIDTGSSMLGVAGAGCIGCGSVPAVYQPSPAAQDLGTQVSASYGDGSYWDAIEIRDEVGFPGLGKFGMVFGDITSSGNGFFSNDVCVNPPTTGIAYSGIVGLAYPALTTQDMQSMWTVMSNSPGVLDANIFAILVCNNVGLLWLGGWNATFLSGAIQYTSIITQTYYVVQLNDVQVGGVSLSLPLLDHVWNYHCGQRHHSVAVTNHCLQRTGDSNPNQ